VTYIYVVWRLRFNVMAALRMLLYQSVSVTVHFLLSTRCDYLLEAMKAEYTIVMNLW